MRKGEIMRRSSCLLLVGFACGMLLTRGAVAGNVILTVGPSGIYHTVSAAVSAADADTNTNNYYTIEVIPGTYTNDFPLVTRPMTIESTIVGQRAVLNATVPLPNEKGIIINVSNLTVNGLTFQGAEISNGLGGNGAGIRDQNGSTTTPYLIVLNSTFVNNQEGILTGNNSLQSIIIVNSTFENNGNPNASYFQHALYVNDGGSLTVTGSLFCGQLIGHDIKSRALVTNVSDNQLYDGQADAAIGCRAGSTSLAIDIANGGTATISGNMISQGAASENSKMVDYGEEGLLYAANNLILMHNTFTSVGLSAAIGIYDPNCVLAQSVGNAFTGVATLASPSSCAVFE
jgi:hypothetical protein